MSWKVSKALLSVCLRPLILTVTFFFLGAGGSGLQSAAVQCEMQLQVIYGCILLHNILAVYLTTKNGAAELIIHTVCCTIKRKPVVEQLRPMNSCCAQYHDSDLKKVLQRGSACIQ